MKRRITQSNHYGRMMLSFAFSWCVIALFGQTTHNVAVTSNVFTPSEITITAGDQVTWTNTQGTHNVNGTQSTYPDNPESFGNNVGSGWEYSFVFETAGVYDYRCDPHVGAGMVGKVIVEEAPTYNLTINFTGMTPHVGQDLWLRVENDDANEEIYRDVIIVDVTFTVEVPGIVAGDAYVVEFFADHNGNGRYDSPSGDHAWQIELPEVTGDETIDFAHNVEFTDIEWEHYAVVNLSGMTPHVGQEIYFALIESVSGEVVDRKSETVSETFSVMLSEIKPGMDYHIDFFADHNDNGFYDAPSVDHAWRLEIASANGDDTLSFSHNVNFVDIEWEHVVKVKLDGMTPHVGQDIQFALIDAASGEVVDKISTIVSESFDVELGVLVPGRDYYVDFYADHNGNGYYDAPGNDHAWRLELENANGDETLEFSHNTNFTDIEWVHTVEVNLTGMTPHVGQSISFALIDATTGDVLDRVYEEVSESFSVTLSGIVGGMDYYVDFYADHNSNGFYDAPGDDHAWREVITSASGDEVIEFSHNTSFTDIEWEHAAVINLSGMTPHVGQEIYFALIETSTGTIVDRISEVVSESFSVELIELVPGMGYHIDFFADHNGNGYYDAPGDDHAWRLEIASAEGDEVIDFMHNTNFTDIEWMHRLRVEFSGMTPHVGQMLKLYVRDQSDGMDIDEVTVDEIMSETFDIESFSIEPGKSYNIDFFADLNGNGVYDAPPVDHAWRIELNDVSGDEVVEFAHNTEFTDIEDAGSTNINNSLLGEGILVYPNPADEFLYVVSKNEYKQLDVISVSGKIIRTIQPEGSGQTVISLDGLHQGVYMIRVKSDKSSDEYYRFIKR